jgi:hypothetical protein
METVIIEEVKHSLVQVFDRTGMAKETIIMLHKFLDAINTKLRENGYQPLLRTHQIGVRCFCNERKAFASISFGDSYFSIKFWTGNKSIIGLEKANWSKSGDNQGSETFRVDDSDTAEQALEYAFHAFLIALES